MRRYRPAALVAGIAAAAVAVVLPTLAPAATSGTLSACNTAGAPAPTGSFLFTFAAPGSAGGTTSYNVAIGSCTGKVYYPVGTQVLVSETVPSGDSVTSITLTGDGTLNASTPSAGTATVTVNSGDTVVTFVTKAAGAPPPPGCVVPRVAGLTLVTARKVLASRHCLAGKVVRVYTSVFPKGGVTGTVPKAGTHLPHNAKVTILVSKGPKP